MTRKTLWLTLLAVVAALSGGQLLAGQAAAQDFPIMPVIYSGTVTVTSGEDPNGHLITARILDYESEPIEVVDGEYEALIVQAPSTAYVDQVMTFHLDGVQASETDTSISPGLPVVKSDFDLTFPSLPEPTPTATPVVISPAVYSGLIAIAGQQPPEQAQLFVRIGGYESPPLTTNGAVFTSLVVAPGESAVGQPVEFFLDGFPSAPLVPALVFQPGDIKTVTLIFLAFPEPTPTPIPATATPVPTSTPPPTATPPPTPTRVPPTATPVPPTATPVPPTATPIPPTATPIPPTRVPAEPTPTPEPAGGGCGSASGRVSALTGLANILLLGAPLALIAGIRRRRGGKR